MSLISHFKRRFRFCSNMLRWCRCQSEPSFFQGSAPSQNTLRSRKSTETSLPSWFPLAIWIPLNPRKISSSSTSSASSWSWTSLRIFSATRKKENSQNKNLQNPGRKTPRYWQRSSLIFWAKNSRSIPSSMQSTPNTNFTPKCGRFTRIRISTKITVSDSSTLLTLSTPRPAFLLKSKKCVNFKQISPKKETSWCFPSKEARLLGKRVLPSLKEAQCTGVWRKARILRK